MDAPNCKPFWASLMVSTAFLIAPSTGTPAPPKPVLERTLLSESRTVLSPSIKLSPTIGIENVLEVLVESNVSVPEVAT